MTGKLQEQVKEVRLSARLTTSPACIVGDTHDMTPTLEKMFRAMGQEVPQVKRILELNPTHPLVTGLREAHEQGRDDDSLAETAELLYGMALLAEGGELSDPARFTRLLADRLARHPVARAHQVSGRPVSVRSCTPTFDKRAPPGPSTSEPGPHPVRTSS